MYRIVLLSACVVVAIADGPGPGPDRKCMKLLRPESMACCKKNLSVFSEDKDFQECQQIALNPHSCDRELCIAVKKGIASSDGTIDKKVLTEEFGKSIDKEPELFDTIKDKCIDGDLAKYGPPDFCELKKMHTCIKIQYINYCPDWDDGGSCNGIKDLVTECKMKMIKS